MPSKPAASSHGPAQTKAPPARAGLSLLSHQFAEACRTLRVGKMCAASPPTQRGRRIIGCTPGSHEKAPPSYVFVVVGRATDPALGFYLPFIAIRLTLDGAVGDFGRVTLRTPFLNDASILSSSMSSSGIRRSNRP